MKSQITFVFALIAFTLLAEPAAMTAELKPIGGITAFGGAERSPGEGANGMGGLDVVGLLPIASNIGLQGGLSFTGGRGFRFGLNAGPVLNFDRGKIGLFGDYEHRAREDYDYAAVRGAGAYYFEQFDLAMSYSQPVSSVKRSDGDKFSGINELHAFVRFYPTEEIELDGGFLVNSFAGAGRKDDGGTGVGGTFGVSFKVFDPVVVQLVQAKFDNRERYRVTSGIQLIFGSALRDWNRAHIVLPPGGGSSGVKNGCNIPKSERENFPTLRCVPNS